MKLFTWLILFDLITLALLVAGVALAGWRG